MLGFTALAGVARSQDPMLVTDVTVDVWPEPGARPRRCILQCNPPRGTVPQPAAACARIQARIVPHMIGRAPALAPPPPPATLEPTPPALPPRKTEPHIVCTQIYSPVVMQIRGLIGGMPVDGVSGGRDGCELSEINTYRELLGIP